MKIIVLGLNHKSAPIEIREKLAFDAADTIKALRQLKDKFHEAEFVLLSTCNRVELYSACEGMGGVPAETIAKFLSGFHNVALEDFQDFLYVHNDADAARHLLTVASSLDSMVVGEEQIIGQVKESYRLACAAKSTGKVLNRLFHCAFATSKKIHANTSISSGRVSVAGIAVELAMQLFADISAAKVVVIGAGEMGELLAVPRNFEPSVNEIENVYLYSIDELSKVAEENLKAREGDITKGTHIIAENVAEFMDWFRSRDIGPLVGQMKKKFAQISQNELEHFFVGVRQEASCREVMEAMVNRIVNKLLHCVIKNVDVVAKKHGPAEAAKFIDSIVRQAEEISAEPNNKDDVQS